MECVKCKKPMLNKDIGGFISCLGINKNWCGGCWNLPNYTY